MPIQGGFETRPYQIAPNHRVVSPMGADAGGHESRQCFTLVRGEAQAELAAPPQHVIRGLRPFPLHQITHLDGGEIRPQTGAKLVCASSRSKHALDPGAVSVHETPYMLLVEERP